MTTYEQMEHEFVRRDEANEPVCKADLDYMAVEYERMVDATTPLYRDIKAEAETLRGRVGESMTQSERVHLACLLFTKAAILRRWMSRHVGQVVVEQDIGGPQE